MFERPALLWLLILAPAIAAPGLMQLHYARRGLKAAAVILRLALFTCLVLALAGLRLSARTGARAMGIVAALDESESIAPDQYNWMRQQVRSLTRMMAPEQEIAVLGFGRDARLAAPMENPRLLGNVNRSANRGGTDIAGAMAAASGLFSPQSEKKLLLITDGNETEGDAAVEAASLREQGVQVFTTLPPPPLTKRMALTEFEAPDAVRAHSSFSFRIDIESESNARLFSNLTISREGRPVGSRAVELHSGLNRFELPYELQEPGAFLLGAEVSAPQGVTLTNSNAEVAVSVLPPPKVLVVSTDPLSSINVALKKRGYNIDLLRPDALPVRAEDYLKYHGVIMIDAPSDLVKPDAQRALVHYVSDFGGGLIASGELLRDPKYHGAPLESALPVSFTQQPPPPTREPVAIYLCIDRSNSMSYNSRYPAVRDNERIRYAKQAAIALLRQLDDTDFAGVIAFDSQPYVLSRLRPLHESRAELENRVERLQPGGGTDFKEALEIAEREIIDSRLGVRQVILLTDGDTNRQYHDHDQLIADYARQRIPVSTIRIGPDLANLRLLEDFAQATGGLFYRVEDIEKLPQLFVRLTRQAMSKTPQGQTKIVAGPRSSILSGITPAEIPPLEFFAATDAKDGASVPLTIERGGRGVPLLAAWQYGLGRAAIFAGDPDSLAAINWIHWDRYVEFWSQLVSWTMRPGQGGLFDLRISSAPDSSLVFEAEKADTVPINNLFCRITAGPRAFDIAMTPVSEALYRGQSAPLPRGKYTATLMRKASDSEQVISSRVFAVPGALEADAAERRIRPPNLELMKRIATETGGQFGASLPEILKRTGPTVVIFRPALPYLLPLAIALLLAEVFLRRRAEE